MEIFFRSTKAKAPQRLLNLHDAFAEDGAGTASALAHVIRDMTMLSRFKDLSGVQKEFVFAIKALHFQETLFRPLFQTFDVCWDPSWRQKKIIQAALDGHYEDGDIEYDFQTYGGTIGIIILILAFEKTDTIWKQWQAISEPRSNRPRWWMVANVVQLAKLYIGKWILDFEQKRGVLYF